MEFGWLYLCLSVTLGGCLEQHSTSSDRLVTSSTLSGLLPSTTAPIVMLPENKTLMTLSATSASEGHSTEGPSVNDTSSSTSQKTTSSATPAGSSTPGVNATATIRAVESDATTARTTRKKTTNKDKYIPLDLTDQSLDAAFKYDYESLRHVGLGVAFILFLSGILVIASSRMSKIPKCCVSSGKTYDVTRV